MENKMTKRDYFNALLAIDGVNAREDLVAFINKEIGLLDKKNASRKSELTDTQKENLEYKDKIMEFLTNATDGKSTSMIAKEFGLSTQRVTPIMMKLVKENAVVVETLKRVNYYKVA